MAGGASLYDDEESPGGGITDINVTPFVDVVLVLLVVFMVTAKLIVARGVDIDKPKADSGGEVKSTLRVEVTHDGVIHVNGATYATDDLIIGRIKELAATTSKPKAIIAGDRKVAYEGVMHAIDLAAKAGITAIALENEAR
ncbi:MAG TPA: biopolymer transporter ExbD [Kofleriaceae bacterium]